MSQFKKNGTMELETSIGYSFSLIKTEYKQNKIYQNKKKTKRTVNLSFQSALCQQSEGCMMHPFIYRKIHCCRQIPPRWNGLGYECCPLHQNTAAATTGVSPPHGSHPLP